MPTSPSLRIMLTSLGVPSEGLAPDYSSNADAYRKLVVWLENMKVRALKVAERTGLADVGSSTWDQHFIKYLSEVECPIPYDPSKRLEVLQWLVRYAVHLEYTDKADELKKSTAPAAPQAAAAAAPAAAGASGKAAAPKPVAEVFPDYGSPELLRQLQLLLQKLHVPVKKGASLAQLLEAAQEVLQDEVLPVARDGGSGGKALKGAAAGGLQALDVLPPGLDTTGDKQLDSAAALLRLLYVRDLRHLQSTIDSAVVEVQEYTANPRTDSSLGKVGR